MAFGASMLRSEMRRHLLMNVALVSSCVVGGTVVTNERGLFVPISLDMSDSARAFAAMFTQSHLLPDSEMTNVRMMSALSPFEVTADSRDLRRRLMDSLQWLPEQAQEYEKDTSSLSQFDNQTLTPTEVASAAPQSPTVTTQNNGTQQAAGNDAAANGAGGNNNQSFNNVNPTTTPNESGVLADQMPAAAGPAAVPEPATWAMLIMGFGFVGSILRRANRRRTREGNEIDFAA